MERIQPFHRYPQPFPEYLREMLNLGTASGKEDPVQAVHAGVRHVMYPDGEGGIQDLWFDGAWHVQRLNRGGATDAPPAASDPVSLVPASNWEYVAYVDIAGQAQLLSRAPWGEWQASVLEGPAQ